MAATALGIVAVVVGATWLFVVRPILLRGRQIANCIELQQSAYLIREFARVKGRHPRTVSEAVIEMAPASSDTPLGKGLDAWGHELIYRTDGQSFILVSLGKGGKAGGLDFWPLRKAPVGDPRAEMKRCTDFDADVMITGDDASRCCCN